MSTIQKFVEMVSNWVIDLHIIGRLSIVVLVGGRQFSCSKMIAAAGWAFAATSGLLVVFTFCFAAWLARHDDEVQRIGSAGDEGIPAETVVFVPGAWRVPVETKGEIFPKGRLSRSFLRRVLHGATVAVRSHASLLIIAGGSNESVVAAAALRRPSRWRFRLQLTRVRAAYPSLRSKCGRTKVPSVVFRNSPILWKR